MSNIARVAHCERSLYSYLGSLIRFRIDESILHTRDNIIQKRLRWRKRITSIYCGPERLKES